MSAERDEIIDVEGAIARQLTEQLARAEQTLYWCEDCKSCHTREFGLYFHDRIIRNPTP